MIRRARKEDALRIAIVKLDVWASAYSNIYPKSKFDSYCIAERAKQFEKTIIEQQVYVAEIDGEIVGFISFGDIVHPYGDFKNELQNFYIIDEYQGMGIGKKMMKICNEYYHSIGVKNFLINCNKYNKKAQQFYERMGARLLSMDDCEEDKSKPQYHYVYETKESTQ